MNVTKQEVSEMLELMAVLFGLPAGLRDNTATPESLTNAYFKSLDGVCQEAFTHAQRYCVNTCRRFPLPSDFQEGLREYRNSQHRSNDGSLCVVL